MSKCIVGALVFIVLTMLGCSDSSNSPNSSTAPELEFPSMKIINNSESASIKEVSLVGYSFNNLDINYNETQTFILDKGMPGGYININVIVRYDSIHMPIQKKYNFANGLTTTITVSRATDFSHYLE